MTVGSLGCQDRSPLAIQQTVSHVRRHGQVSHQLQVGNSLTDGQVSLQIDDTRVVARLQERAGLMGDRYGRRQEVWDSRVELLAQQNIQRDSGTALG